MRPERPTQFEEAAETALLPVSATSGDIWSVLLVNAACRAFARIAAHGEIDEPNWADCYAEITREGEISIKELLRTETHPGCMFLGSLVGVSRRVANAEYRRAFFGEILAHQFDYEEALMINNAPLQLLDRISTECQHESVLRRFESMIGAMAASNPSVQTALPPEIHRIRGL